MKNMTDNRASQIESMLQKLPQQADQALGGLTAGPHLKARIQLTASEPRKARSLTSLLSTRLAPIACGVAALVLCVALGVNALPHEQPTALIHSNTMGEPSPVPGVLTSDLNNSSVFISASNNNPGWRSIWADTKDGSFPMVGVNGKYYRMLTTPRSVSSSLIGSSLGTVAEYTTEPSLSGTDTILSNTASFGTEIFAIRGMGDTLVTAEVDGKMRLFQRVSFNGNALRSREALDDTLQIDGRVIAMELSSIGTITDPAVCQELLSILFDCASYESSGTVSSRQTLLMELENGLVLQMAVKSDSLAACGVWSCPEFFEAFEDACN